MNYDDECQHCEHTRVMHPMGHACLQTGCRCQTFEKPVFTSPKCRHCGHAKVMHVYGRLCDHDRCKCLIFRPPAVRSTGLDRCRCGHISDNHMSSGTCLLGGCSCVRFEYPEMCICGHPKASHYRREDYCNECSKERARYYCSTFRSTTPEPQRCSPAPFKITETTGDTTMSDISYSQGTTLKNALDWMRGELRSSSTFTWNQLSALTAREIVTRYADRQRAIIAELTAVTALLDNPVSDTVESLHNDWGWRVSESRENAERELRNAEELLALATVAEPAATTTTFTVTVTETPAEA